MVFKIEKNQNYTVMSNHHLRDKNLSLKAKGLLSFMLSLPEDWDYSISGLVSICKEEETAIKTALKELKNQKYLRINKLYPNQTKTGKIEYEYVIYEEPYYEKKQEVENQPLEFQELENNIQINTNKQNTKKQIDKIDKTISHEEESNYQSNKKKKRHILTKDIIKREYIKSNDIELLKYDKFFKKILETYDIDDIAKILHYVIKSVKGRNFKDENNKKIENKFGYLKKSILENIDKFKNNEIEWDEELGWFKDTSLFNNLNENEEEMDYDY